MAPALQRVRALQATPLGVSLDAPVRRVGDFGSPLGNLFAEALRDAAGADVAALNNAGRLWADVPAGPITLGQIYDVFPFDNRLAKVTVSGVALRQWVANELRRGGHANLGISGVKVQAACTADGLHIDLFRGTDRIQDDERLVAVAIGAPTLSGSLASPAWLGGVGPTDNAPVVRELVEDWFRRLGHLTPDQRAAALQHSPGNGDAHAIDCVAPNAPNAVR